MSFLRQCAPFAAPASKKVLPRLAIREWKAKVWRAPLHLRARWYGEYQHYFPAEVYQPSPRLYTGLPDIDYPFHDKTIVVTRCGRICLGNKKINFSQVFAGQAVGIKEVHDDIWLVSFMDYDLGYFDLETRVLEPLENPFGPKVSPM